MRAGGFCVFRLRSAVATLIAESSAKCSRIETRARAIAKIFYFVSHKRSDNAISLVAWQGARHLFQLFVREVAPDARADLAAAYDVRPLGQRLVSAVNVNWQDADVRR